MLALLTVLAVALLVRAHAVTQARNIARDGTVYLTMAHEMTLQSPGQLLPHFHYHPGYPAVVAMVASAVGAEWPLGWVAVGQWVSVAMSLLALAMLYVFACFCFDRKIAMVTTLLVAISGPITEVSSDCLSDASAAAMAMTAIVLALVAGRRITGGSAASACDLAASAGAEAGAHSGSGTAASIALSACAGLAGGVAYLFRPEALLAVAAAAVVLLVMKVSSRRQRLIRAACLMIIPLAAAACVLPYATAVGELTPKKNVDDFALAAPVAGPALASVGVAQATPSARLLKAMRRTLDRARAAMGTPLTVLVVTCWATWLGTHLLRLRFPPGVVFGLRAAPLAAMALVVGAIFALLTALEANHPRYISARHALLAVLLMSPCAGAGFMILVGWMQNLAGRLEPILTRAVFHGSGLRQKVSAAMLLTFRRRPGAATAILLVVVLASMAPVALPVPHHDKGCYRQAGLEIASQFGRGHNVLASDGWAPFYAGSPWRELSVSARRLTVEDLASVEKLLSVRTAAGESFDFLVIPERLLNDAPQPGIAGQIQSHPRLRRVGVWQSEDHRALAYQIVP